MHLPLDATMIIMQVVQRLIDKFVPENYNLSLKLNQKEYRDVFLKMYGISAYITYMPFFAYMTLRRILKKILKK